MQLHFRHEGRLIEVAVAREGDRWRVLVDGAASELRTGTAADGTLLVETRTGRRRFLSVAAGDERLVFSDGCTWRLRLAGPDQADDADGPAGGPNLCAAMPGKVVQVLATVGQEVTAGQPLLIMESMKMETELTAAVDGTVAAVHVRAGQVVGLGDPLLDISGRP